MDILFFAIVAFVIAYKYYSVLGKAEQVNDDDFEDKQKEIRKKLTEELKMLDVSIMDENAVIEKDKEPVEISNNSNEKVVEVIKHVNKKNLEFTEKFFIKGVVKTFEMLSTSFNNHDLSNIKELVSKEIIEKLQFFIDQQKAKKIRIKSTLVKIIANIIDASIDNDIVKFIVKIDSEQIILKYNEENQLISGNSSLPTLVSDTWYFEKDTKNIHNNWIVTKIDTLS